MGFQIETQKYTRELEYLRSNISYGWLEPPIIRSSSNIFHIDRSRWIGKFRVLDSDSLRFPCRSRRFHQSQHQCRFLCSNRTVGSCCRKRISRENQSAAELIWVWEAFNVAIPLMLHDFLKASLAEASRFLAIVQNVVQDIRNRRVPSAGGWLMSLACGQPSGDVVNRSLARVSSKK